MFGNRIRSDGHFLSEGPPYLNLSFKGDFKYIGALGDDGELDAEDPYTKGDYSWQETFLYVEESAPGMIGRLIVVRISTGINFRFSGLSRRYGMRVENEGHVNAPSEYNVLIHIGSLSEEGEISKLLRLRGFEAPPAVIGREIAWLCRDYDRRVVHIQLIESLLLDRYRSVLPRFMELKPWDESAENQADKLITESALETIRFHKESD